MEALRLYRIEAVVVDDRLTKQEVERRLGSFFISLEVSELDVAGSKKPAAKKASAKKPAAKKRRGSNRGRIFPQTQERIDQIAKALGKKSMTVAQIAEATGIDLEAVRTTIETAEKHRIFTIKMIPNKGTRPIRSVSVTR